MMGFGGIMKLAHELGSSAGHCYMPCSERARVTGVQDTLAPSKSLPVTLGLPESWERPAG